jgi:hypothetical protein
VDTAVRTSARSESGVSELEQLIERLDPKLNREWVLQRLQEIFVAGQVPDPVPEGFLRGRLVTMSMSGPFDGGVRRLAHLWMPWLGKSFDPETSSGINILKKGAAAPMKLLWPKHSPRRDLGDRIEAFPFQTWVGAGKVDPEIQVLKIDYDFEANPGFIIRDILDELVQVADRLYLGKVLLRWRGSHQLVGYFSLAG